MATKTKTTLKSTTAHTVPATVPTPELKNEPLLIPPDDVTALMKSAYDDTKKGSTLTERGSQRSVCAVMHHMAQVIYDETFTHALRDASLNTAYGKDTRGAINEIMVDRFVSPLPSTADMGEDEKRNAMDTHDKHVRLVKRSVLTAAILEANGVVATDFDYTRGRFTVPSAILYPLENAVALDRLLDNKYVPLDGEAINYWGRTSKGKQKVMYARASVSQVLSMRGPTPTKRKTSGTQADKKATPQADDAAAAADTLAKELRVNLSNPTYVASKVPVETMIAALHELWIVDGPAEPVARDAMPDKYWNMLSEIMQRFDESKASWDKAAMTKAA